MKNTLLLNLLVVFCLSFQFSWAQSGTTDTLSYVADPTVHHNWLYLGDNTHPQPKRVMTVKTDVAVIGAGIAGMSAAVAAARQGASVVLINDRPVLGGNASSEMRVTVNGAHCERETGIVEELLLANKKYNMQESYPVWDHVLYNYMRAEPNLTVMLNTQAVKAVMDGKDIKEAICWQSSTETHIKLIADVYIDCSGDGFLAASAGADYRTGREARSEFNEKYAPETSDGWQQGECIMMITKDMGKPAPFVAPSYARKFHADKAFKRNIKNLKEGFWWVEISSDADGIGSREATRDSLMAYFYGVWDYVKNSGKFPQAKNLALDWVGSIPGRRESRRFMGDYILNSTDMLEHKHFEDAVAWGGWSLDEHCPGGIKNLTDPPSYFHDRFKTPYEIPYRSLYSRNVSNLMLAGRDISVTHIALSSTRIMGTCGVEGQAVGVAAAMCVENNINPRDIYPTKIKELQQRMLRQDYYIPNVKADDNKDLAQKVKRISASDTSEGDVKFLLDGIARDVQDTIHHWTSASSKAYVDLEWKRPVELSSVEIKFDTNLHRGIMMHKDPAKYEERGQIQGVPPELVKDFTIEAKIGKEWKQIAEVKDNIRRFVPVKFDSIKTKAVRVKFNDTYGLSKITVFELRCYN